MQLQRIGTFQLFATEFNKMKKLGAEAVIILILVPVLLAFGGYVHSKIGDNSEKLIFLESSRDYVEEDIREMKTDIKEILRRLK